MRITTPLYTARRKKHNTYYLLYVQLYRVRMARSAVIELIAFYWRMLRYFDVGMTYGLLILIDRLI